MTIYTAYPLRIKEYNHIFEETLVQYRHALDFYLKVIDGEWDTLQKLKQFEYIKAIEAMTVPTKAHPSPKYDFTAYSYKFPCYLRRSVIAEAYGRVSSYRGNLANWQKQKEGKRPQLGNAGFAYPAMYRKNMLQQNGDYEYEVKIYIRNTWDWLKVQVRKSDADYIKRHCADRRECVPVLQRKGRKWSLVFSYEEKVGLSDKPINKRKILAVDLGVNNACACCVMLPDGTILGRHILNLPSETDSLEHKLNKLKKAQRLNARHAPKMWAAVDGVNDRIAVHTAQFIADTAKLYNVDVVVFEHLDTHNGMKGSKKQRVHLWCNQRVIAITANKVHRMGKRVSTVNARGTSQYAFDGSGIVKRGTYKQDGEAKYNYSICVFPNGKTYNCDLNASYNIGARYFIRELLKPLPATVRLGIEAKVPQCAKRSTCTLSTLISLNAALMAATA